MAMSTPPELSGKLLGSEKPPERIGRWETQVLEVKLKEHYQQVMSTKKI